MHSKFSPSGSKKWLYCEGSLDLEASLNLPESTNAASELGTGVHEVGEICLTKYVEYLCDVSIRKITKPSIYLDDIFNGHKITQDCIDAVTIYFEYCKDLIDVNGVENCYIEKTFIHPNIDELGGTSDFSTFSWITGIFEVVDYKNGTGVAEWPENNSQEMIYAILIYCSLSQAKRSAIKTFRLTIIQPRHYQHKEDGGICSWNISKIDLMKWAKEVLFPTIKRIKAGKGKLKASDDACRFCLAWNNCDKRKSNIDLLKSMIESKKVNLTEEDMAEIDYLFNSDPKENEYLRNEWVIDNEKLILDYIKKSKEFAMYRLLNGNNFSNMKVVQGLKNTTYNDNMSVEDLIEDVQDHYGIAKPDLLKDPEFISFTDLKALLKTKKVPKKEIDKYVDGITERLDGDLKMVHIDSKGKSVTTLTVNIDELDFSDIESEETNTLIFE